MVSMVTMNFTALNYEVELHVHVIEGVDANPLVSAWTAGIEERMHLVWDTLVVRYISNLRLDIFNVIRNFTVEQFFLKSQLFCFRNPARFLSLIMSE